MLIEGNPESTPQHPRLVRRNRRPKIITLSFFALFLISTVIGWGGSQRVAQAESGAGPGPAGCRLLNTQQVSAVLGGTARGPFSTLAVPELPPGGEQCLWVSDGVMNSASVTWMPHLRMSPAQFFASKYSAGPYLAKDLRSVKGIGNGAVELVTGGPFGEIVFREGPSDVQVALTLPSRSTARVQTDLRSLAEEAAVRLRLRD